MEACILDSSSENASLVYRQQIDPHNTKYVLVHGVRLILENRHEANEFLNGLLSQPLAVAILLLFYPRVRTVSIRLTACGTLKFDHSRFLVTIMIYNAMSRRLIP